MQPVGEQTGGTAAGAQSPYGDDRDNLVLDFGMVRTFCIGNRVFLDDGSGGGTANDGIQNGTEPGIPNAAVRIFAADASGNPTGNALVIGTDNLTAALTNPDGWYRFFRLAPGDYVVVVDVGLSTNLTGFVFKDGSTWVDPAATSTSLVGMVSSAGYSSDLTLTGDRRDHGKDAPVSVGCVTYGIAGPKITLGPGLQPLGEQTNSVSGPSAHSPTGDAYDNLVMDFGFAPTFSIGNRIFWDNGEGGGTAGNGVRDGGEPGIAGVRVEVRANGTTLATTVTDAEGYYRFDNLLTGEYTVFLPPSNFSLSGALSGMLSSTNTTAGENGDKGIDNNYPATNGIESGKVTIGFGAQPAGETDTSTGAGANSPFGDNYDNLTIDFGMIEVNSVNCSAGSLVWNDANNNGRHDAGESGIAGVTLEIWKADPDGDLIGPAPLQATTTAADGTYLFNDIEPGLYRIRIPATMFASGGPLEIINTASTLYSAADDQIDNDSNGAQSAAGQAVLGPLFQLSRGGEPEDDTVPNEFGPGATQDNHSPRLDDNGDMTMDFGFYAPTLAQTNLVSLGSLVWSDLNNNGTWDSGEPGISGVTLELYITNATGLIYWGTTQSASDGTYFFRDLVDNTNWVVRIPASNFAPGGALYGTPLSSGTPVNADNQADGDNNALQPGGFGAEVWSPVIALTAGNEPTNESGLGGNQDSASPYIDANGDMTLDFGFTPVYSLGNRVFADLDNNGVMDAGESGIGGVPLLLFAADASGNPTGVALATNVTDSAGWYRFDDLVAGSYVVVADVANADALAHWVSSTGVSSDTTLAGDGRDHGRDTPVSAGTVAGGIASVAVTLGPGAQAESEETGEGAGAHSPHGDARDNLTLDFGFTPTYSIGNWVFRDNENNGISCMKTNCTCGVSNVVMRLFAADGNGAPTGAVVSTVTTCAKGYYRFDGILPGTYVVVLDKANAPELANYRSSTGVTGQTGLGADLRDNGLDTPLGEDSVVPGGIVSRPVTVGYGLQPEREVEGSVPLSSYGPLGDAYDDLTVDFAFYPLYSLGNRVFFDNGAGGGTANDGIQNGGEVGIAGVALKLFAADSGGNPTGDVVVATTTDADGWYRFDGLEAGRYVAVVDVANSPGLIGKVNSAGVSTDTTLDGDGRDHGYDTPVSVGTVVNGIASVAVVLGMNDLVLPTGEAVGEEGAGANGTNGDAADNLTLDFGFTAVASVSGSVFEDVNANGIINPEDTNRLAGVTVNLTTPCGAVQATTVTDSLGRYSFTDLAPGDYAVTIVGLPGWYATGDAGGGNGRRVAVTLASGQNQTGVDFLEARPGMIGGTVWNDLDADGDFSEVDMTHGIEGVTVSLKTNGVVVATTTTMADGRYIFNNVVPGSYDIVQSDLPGWSSTADSDGGDANRIAVSLPSGGQSSDNNFLDYTTASISGRVLVDVNGNGQVDAEDVNGISGVTVKLLDADNNQVGQQVTGADGAFTFANLLPGSYTLVETDPAGYVSTSANQLSVTVTSGQESRGHAFLDTRNGNIGDFVWEDLNGNGVQDSGEPGLSNVVVRLLDVHGVEVASTLTDANGMYLFSERLPGAYVLDVAAPAGYVPTRYQQGDAPALDNDINPLTGLSDLVMLTAGQTNLTADAGFVVPAVVRGYAFIDTVSDLLRDTGDTTVTNLPVHLMVDGVVVASTNTDASGYYEFGAVPPGVVSVLVPRMGSKLVGVPNTDDERRNRAVDAGEDAVIVYTVLSGAGVLDGRPSEMLNFGFENHPLSTAIDIRLYATPDGVMIQLWTVNEAGCGDIVIYAWIDDAWAEVGRVPAWLVVGEGANAYTVAANGLAAGGAYYLRVIDEVGNEHLSLMPVAVGTLEVDAVRLDLQHVTLRFNTEPGRRYQIEVSTDLVTWRTEYVSAPTATGWTAFATEPFMAGPGAYTEVRAPRNGRSRAFFKIRCIE
jgi:protocatechuate 3,4-dioxygenase beta subunit